MLTEYWYWELYEDFPSFLFVPLVCRVLCRLNYYLFKTLSPFLHIYLRLWSLDIYLYLPLSTATNECADLEIIQRRYFGPEATKPLTFVETSSSRCFNSNMCCIIYAYAFGSIFLTLNSEVFPSCTFSTLVAARTRSRFMLSGTSKIDSRNMSSKTGNRLPRATSVSWIRTKEYKMERKLGFRDDMSIVQEQGHHDRCRKSWQQRSVVRNMPARIDARLRHPFGRDVASGDHDDRSRLW